MQDTQEKPDINEMYSIATHASNLRVEADRGSPADILIAAGWSPSRLGSALIRLHSEFDGIEHPKRGTSIYAHEFKMMLGKLKTLPEVRHQLTLQAIKWEMANAEGLASTVLMWWLDKVCPSCHGVKFQLIPNTPSLSTRFCRRCRGTGEAQLLDVPDAKRMVNHIEMSLNAARQGIKRRLHP